MAVVKRPRSSFWYIRKEYQGKKYMFSTKTKNLDEAQKIHEEMEEFIRKRKGPEGLSKFYQNFGFVPTSLVAENTGLASSYPVQIAPYPLAVAVPKPEKPMPIKKVFDIYLQTCRTRNEAQTTIYRKEKTKELLMELKFRTMADFNQENINRFLEYLNSTDMAGDSKDAYINKLRAFLRWSLEQDYIRNEAYIKLKFPHYGGKTRETTVTPEDYRLILDKIDDIDFRMYIKTLWNTGMRPSEAKKMQVKDLDLDISTFLDGQEFKNGLIHCLQSKVKNRPKDIVIENNSFIDEPFLDEMKAFIEGREPEEYIFIGIHKSPTYYTHKFAKLRAKLYLNIEYNLYAFRHTFGTNQYEKTDDLLLVQNQLGHSKVSTTQKYVNRKNKNYIRKINHAKLLKMREGGVMSRE